MQLELNSISGREAILFLGICPVSCGQGCPYLVWLISGHCVFFPVCLTQEWSMEFAKKQSVSLIFKTKSGKFNLWEEKKQKMKNTCNNGRSCANFGSVSSPL